MEIVKYGTVLFTGPSKSLTQLAAELRRCGYSVGRPNTSIMCVDDIYEDEIAVVRAEAEDYGCYFDSYRGVQREASEAPAPQPVKVTVTPGKWYFAEALEETHPFVFVREIQNQKTAQDARVPILDLEFMGVDGSTPENILVDAERAKTYGMRPASAEDFTEFDLPVPIGVQSEEDTPTVGSVDHNKLANFGE